MTNASGTPGTSRSAGCRTVTALHSPQGRLEALRTVPGGKVYLQAWALDPDVAGSTQIQVNVDKNAPLRFTASAARSDVDRVWPGFGPSHGLRTTMTLAVGWHSVCVSGVNASGTPGSGTSFGCRACRRR